MNTNIRERDGITIIDIQDKIIGPDSMELKSIIKNLIALKGLGEAKILLNLAEVPMMDSLGLGAIVAAYTTLQRKKGRIALLNIGRSIRQLFVITKLINFFETYDNEDEAIASLK
jgi:anti-sigma B factor antagonist